MGEGLLEMIERIDKYMTRGKVAICSLAVGSILGYTVVPRGLKWVKKKIYNSMERLEAERAERQAKLTAKYVGEELRKFESLKGQDERGG